MNERLRIKLSYEDACRISGVPKERGYVTLQEVVDAINEEFGLNLKGSDQVGWLKDRIIDQNSSTMIARMSADEEVEVSGDA